MKDNVRQELKELCYFIIENNNALSRPEQLTRVQMLYERLLVLNYLEEVEAEKKASARPQNPAPAESHTPPKPETKQEPKPEPKPEPVSEEQAPQLEEKPTEAERAEETQISREEAPLEGPSAHEQEIPEVKPEPSTSEKEDTNIEREEPIAEESATERRDLNDGHQAPKSINDQLGKGAIQVGLNDRIAFVKHLFNDSQADFNRVLSQLNTLDTYLESMYFLENLVKPDYDWEDKKPYEERLINLVKKRFGEDW